MTFSYFTAFLSMVISLNRFQNGTPFRFNENCKAVDFFGAQLRQAGYSYYGSEPMYSGITGDVFPADIYIGVVYYQRLRHMVSDKSQVRAACCVLGSDARGRSHPKNSTDIVCLVMHFHRKHTKPTHRLICYHA